MSKRRDFIERTYQRFKSSLFDTVPAAHEQALADFRMSEFGVRSLQQIPDFNRWLYRKNSANVRYYCFDGGQVVGHQAAMGVDLKLAGRTVKAAYAIDLKVRADWKMKGLAVAMTGALMNRFDILIALGVSDDAYKMFKRQGWQDLGCLNFYIKPMTPKGAERNNTSSSLSSWWRNGTAFFLSKVADISVNNLARRANVKALDSFTREHEALCEALYGQHSNQIKRSEHYLNWRFCEFPGKNPYRIFEYRLKNQNLVGFMIVKECHWHGKKALVVVELQAYSEHIRTLVNESIQMAKSKSVDVLLYQCIDSNLEKRLKRSLFYQRPYGDRFLVYCEQEELIPMVCDISNWQVSYSESDMDFCFY